MDPHMKRWLSCLLAAFLLVLTACTGAPQSAAPSAPQDTATAILPVGTPGASADPAQSESGPIETAPPESEAPQPSPTETAPAQTPPAEPAPTEELLAEDGSYTAKEDVALYIHLYGGLPCNFITKRDAQDLGWSGGSLEPYAPGMCIGGSRFGNYEGLLPKAEGRVYTECDIDTLGAESRGAKRIVFSNDGLIYYTEDHYASFELLYGEEP